MKGGVDLQENDYRDLIFANNLENKVNDLENENSFDENNSNNNFNKYYEINEFYEVASVEESELFSISSEESVDINVWRLNDLSL